MPLLRCFGYVGYFMSLILYVVIIKPPHFFSPKTSPFVSTLSTLISIDILFYDKVLSSLITTPHVAASHQRAYTLTEVSRVAFDDSFCRKLGLFDLYTLAGRGRGVSGYSSF